MNQSPRNPRSANVIAHQKTEARAGQAMATISFNHQGMCHFHVFKLPAKSTQARKSDTEMHQAVHNWFYHQTTEFYQMGIHHFIYRRKNVSS
jgi:hypothetical protein